MSLGNRARYLLAGALLAASACAGGRTVPVAGVDAAPALRAPDVDTTSVLKSLTKNVTIGSTVDPKNGDRAPRGIMVALSTYGKLTKGQIVACNSSNKANVAGQGSTVEVLDPKAGSKPKTFAQTASVKGCTALTADSNNIVDPVWGTSPAGKAVTQLNKTGGVYAAVLSPAFVMPFGAVYSAVDGFGSYGPKVVFVGDASTGSISRINVAMPGSYTNTVVATGFAVNKKSGAAALGPFGLAYDPKADVLYITDGVDNTVVAFTKASTILLKNAIKVLPGGKTFSGPEAKQAKLLYAGSALKSPVASALLPNGNLIVANTTGNSLVEMTSAGKVLATKTVDTKSTPGVFGIVASGTKDSNTVLFFTDTNTNTVQELTR